MAEIRFPPLPAGWGEPYRNPVSKNFETPPAIIEYFEKLQVARREYLRRRYGEPLLGAALRRLIEHQGMPPDRKIGGRDAWEIVEAWDSAVSSWLHSMPNTFEVWDALKYEVSQAKRAANTQARKISLLSAKSLAARAQSDGVAYAERNPPAKARTLLKLGVSDEAYAFVAVNRWRSRARLAAVPLGDLPPLPDEGEEGGRAITATPAPVIVPEAPAEPPTDGATP